MPAMGLSPPHLAYGWLSRRPIVSPSFLSTRSAAPSAYFTPAGGGRDLKAAIGPGIHGCCYEVGQEVREQFASQFAYAAKLFREIEETDPVREKYPMLFLTARAPGHSDLPKKIFLDLVEANRQQLLAVGLPAKGIEASPLCTYCRTDLLFSYRAEKGRTGRMMAVVGIRPGPQESKGRSQRVRI